MIRMLDAGPLTREELVPEYATTRKYINGKGVKRLWQFHLEGHSAPRLETSQTPVIPIVSYEPILSFRFRLRFQCFEALSLAIHRQTSAD